MPRIDYLNRSEVWIPDADTIQSFRNGIFQGCRVHGPVRLVRLLSHVGTAPEGQHFDPNREDGSYWFPEAQFFRLELEARADLQSQGATGSNGGLTRNRLRAYLRIRLRSLLAVRRDWTPSFDYCAKLEIPNGKSIIALMGRVGRQPVYDPKTTAGQQATKKGIWLEGGFTQYVIDFHFGPNVGWEKQIQGPFPF